MQKLFILVAEDDSDDRFLLQTVLMVFFWKYNIYTNTTLYGSVHHQR